MFPVLAGSNPSGYNLTRSLRFRKSASAYLNRTMTTATDAKKWTWSAWVKRGLFGASAQAGLIASGNATTDGSGVTFIYGTGEFFNFYDYISSSFTTNLITTQVFRDPSAWYHFVVAVDTTQATASNRVKMYVNGTQITSFSTAVYPALNSTGYMNSGTYATTIGREGGFGNYYDGYMTEMNFVDGQQLTPSSFGSTNLLTGVWQPARYSGTYGTNGFYLPFTDNSALTTSSNVGLGKDFSGNGNYWTTNNISITAGATYDSMTDVPTLTSATAANFAVLNRLFNTPAEVGLSAGNLNYNVGASSTPVIAATIGVSTGKWYWEVTATSTGNNVGIIGLSDTRSLLFVGGSATSYSYFNSGVKYNNSSGTSYGASYTTNDVIGVALDLTAGTLTFYKNNTSQGTAFSSLSGTFFPACGNDGTTSNCVFNFGQRPFTYTPPTGFVALNTYNLPTSTIVKGNTVMDATLYTGNGSTQTITNAAGFKPDLVWAKARSSASWWHILVDSVRGVGRTLSSNVTNAEIGSGTDLIPAINSNGFNVNVSPNATVNENATTYVAWQWQAGQGTNTTNTNGTITSTVSVNASAGFSVVTYTGTAVAGTIGHGLGVAPQLIIVKPRTGTITTDAWNVYHVSIGNTQFLALNSTDAATTATNRWNSTSPTSSVFSIGTVPSSNAVGYVAYCWTPIAGYSAFGSYTGNGSADGTFVYTGFRPRFILFKITSTSGDWLIIDTARDTYNGAINDLFPNVSNAETNYSGAYPTDILSNGFKLRNSVFPNASGGTYIYMAFAENPFKNSLAR